MPTTTEQRKAALAVVLAASETIREAREVPTGHLYAVLMSFGCDMEQYRQIENILIGSRMVAKSGEMLRWVGPEIN